MSYELCAIAAAIEAGNGTQTPFIGKIIQNAPESCDDGRLGEIAASIRAMRATGEPVSVVSLCQRHMAHFNFIMTELSAALPAQESEYQAEKCWQAFQFRRSKSVFDDASQALAAAPTQSFSIIANVRAALESLANDALSAWL